MGAPAIRPGGDTRWTILSGPMKGSVRMVQSQSFVIGRSPECEVVLMNDPKCSRRHAQVQWSELGCEISSLNAQNLVLVNGREVQTALLKDDDLLILGDTEVKFNLPSAEPGGKRGTQISVLPQTPPMSQQPYSAPAYYNYPPPQTPQTQRASRKAKPENRTRFIIYGVIGLVVLFFLTSTSTKKKQEQLLRTEQQIQADVETANKLHEAAVLQQDKRNDGSVPARQAQENFVRGFRDYRKGQFERALESFQACLALNPQHLLCQRYITQAQKRFQEIVQYNIVLGRKYRDQNQFQACRSAFRNVMVMVKDANSIAYKESKANYDACNAFVEGRF